MSRFGIKHFGIWYGISLTFMLVGGIAGGFGLPQILGMSIYFLASMSFWGFLKLLLEAAGYGWNFKAVVHPDWYWAIYPFVLPCQVAYALSFGILLSLLGFKPSKKKDEIPPDIPPELIPGITQPGRDTAKQITNSGIFLDEEEQMVVEILRSTNKPAIKVLKPYHLDILIRILARLLGFEVIRRV